MAYLPNLLTFIRILLIPVFISLFLQGNYIESGIVFCFSALTDFFDGYIARKYDLISKFGRILDPLADKLTVISILITLAYVEFIPGIIAVILLTREIIVMIGSAVAYLLGVDVINPSLLGRISISLLYIAITAKLLDIDYVNITLFYIVIPLNIISGINYVFSAIKEYQN